MLEKATFAAGCFWGVEQTFHQTHGVTKTTVGYTGGTLHNPTYHDVCSSTTGHAEAVEVIFDPTIINYQQLLDVFFNCHNPTTLNRQGPDVGSQYRSAIFYHSAEQQQLAQKAKQELQKTLPNIVTEIVPATTFYPAEEYHQQYFKKHGGGHCA
jgi:peptide-methionine (S)-S-oxide reductase